MLKECLFFACDDQMIGLMMCMQVCMNYTFLHFPFRHAIFIFGMSEKVISTILNCVS